MVQFSEGGKTVAVWPGAGADRPVVYLNTFGDEGERVYRELRADAGLDFTLVAVSGLEWDHDMVPWDIPPIFEGDTACTGGADDYLELLVGGIMPRAERDRRVFPCRIVCGVFPLPDGDVPKGGQHVRFPVVSGFSGVCVFP